MFSIKDIQTFNNNLKRHLDRARHGNISFDKALLTALDIEKSLLEWKYFKIFEGGSEEDWHVLESLSSATENHIKVIQSHLEQH